MTASRPDRIAEGAKALGVVLNDEQVAMLHRYLDLLEKWNAAYNLTAIRQREAMEVEHVLDSLSVAPFLADTGETIVDVGTGAGLPGLVLAIAKPANRYVLVDSNGKKTRFLAQVVHALNLSNVEVRHARVEDIGEELAGQATTVVSRAFTSLANMVDGCNALLLTGAQLLAMKGARPDSEIAELPPNIRVSCVKEIQVPGLNKSRHLVGIVRHDRRVAD